MRTGGAIMPDAETKAGTIETAPPADEAARMAALRRYRILDTDPEPAFDRIVSLLALLLDVPIALISLIDTNRQWFKAGLGLEVRETPRCIAFCDHAIRGKEVFVVPDAKQDPRFVDNPLVTGAPFLRFYAGVPLLTGDGHALGTLCALSRAPRELDPRGERILSELAAQVMHELDVRAALGDLYQEVDRGQNSERALRSTNLQLAALLNVTANAVVAADIDTRVIAWNRAAEEMFGYTPQEIAGQPMARLLSDSYRDAEAPFLSLGPAVLGGTPRLLHGRRRDGREFPMEVFLASWDDPLATASFGVIIRDVTLRSQRLDEINRSRIHLAEAQQLAGLGSWDWTVKDDGITVSEQMARFLGLPNDRAVTAQTFLSRIHSEDRADFKAEIARVLAGGPSSTLTFRVWGDHDTLRTMRGSSRLVKGWDGRVTRLIGVALDITDLSRREAAERQREKLAALGELAGGVAHELNNLLQPILSLVELALDTLGRESLTEAERAEMREHFVCVLDYTRQGRDIVRKILRFARKEEPVRSDVDFIAEVCGTFAFLRGVLPPAIKLETAVDPAAAGLARINVVELAQIVTNLVVNAADAMRGQGRLTMSVAEADLLADESERLGVEPGRYFVLVVADTGPGMSDATLSRIFEPFFTTKPVGEGTGLGLALVHGIVQSWSGAIKAESALGQGATFTLYIPKLSGHPSQRGDLNWHISS